MIKQISILSVLAAALMLVMEEFKEILNCLLKLNKFFLEYLEFIFTTGKIGTLISETFALLLVCTIVTAAPACIYALIFKKRMPWMIEIFTIVLLLTASVITLT